MSDKSILPSPKLGFLARRDLIETNYGALTEAEIAVKAGVSRKTIERDVSKWKASGRYDEWLDERWHGLLEDPEIKKSQIFGVLTRIKLRRMVEKVESHITGSQEVTVKKSDMSFEELITRVPPEQRSAVLDAIRAAWRAEHQPQSNT